MTTQTIPPLRVITKLEQYLNREIETARRMYASLSDGKIKMWYKGQYVAYKKIYQQLKILEGAYDSSNQE